MILAGYSDDNFASQSKLLLLHVCENFLQAQVMTFVKFTSISDN